MLVWTISPHWIPHRRQVTFEGNQCSLFDLVEDLDSSACIAKLLSIADQLPTPEPPSLESAGRPSDVATRAPAETANPNDQPQAPERPEVAEVSTALALCSAAASPGSSQ